MVPFYQLLIAIEPIINCMLNVLENQTTGLWKWAEHNKHSQVCLKCPLLFIFPGLGYMTRLETHLTPLVTPGQNYDLWNLQGQINVLPLLNS